MSIFLIILIILLIIFWPIIKRLYSVYRTINHARQSYRDFTKGFGGGFGGNYANDDDDEEEPNPYAGYYHKSRKKIFSKNDGEYVKFQEIQEERHVSTMTDDDTESKESRITDVKFEEICDKK